MTSQLPQSLSCGSSEPIFLQRRRDLRFERIDAARWNVFDPVTRQSYRVGLVEHWLLTRPDGRTSTLQLLERLRTEIPRLTIANDHLASCLATFVQNKLLWSNAWPSSSGFLSKGAGQEPSNPATSDGQQLAANKLTNGTLWQEWLASMVSWQIRGLNPDRWLASCVPYSSIWFSSQAVRVWLLLALLTGLAVMLEFQRLAAQSLSLDWMLHPTTAGSLFVVFLITRGLHEVGHAVVCKRMGIRCPDIGVFLILGAPCVYCDVSESWQLPYRWQRAAVAAAGMYVELIIATLAAWFWLATVEGPANTLALQTLIVCSVSTVVINANPLMRFDGYYILADLLDEVNLRSKADSVAASALRWLVLGVRLESSSDSAFRQRFLLVFSLAGWLYRALLSLTIASVLVGIYDSWNLLWIGRFLASAILISWWGVPTVKLSLTLFRTARQHRRSWRLAAATAALVMAIACVPLPSRQFSSGWLQPAQSRGIYAGSTASLVACTVRDGAKVKVGDELFQLRSDQLRSRLVRYQQASDVAEIRLKANTRRRDMHAEDVDLQHDNHQLEQARSWLSATEQEVGGLNISSPIDGHLIAMPAPSASELSATGDSTSRVGAGEQTDGDGSLPSTWCDPQQVGRLVPVGSMLASVCSSATIAVVPLSEEQLSRVAAGSVVHLRIAHQQRILRDCRVQSVVQIDELSSPWQAAALSAWQTSVEKHGGSSPVRFAAVITVPEEVGGLPGSTVDAVFVAPATTLLAIVNRWIQSNLRLLAD